MRKNRKLSPEDQQLHDLMVKVSNNGLVSDNELNFAKRLNELEITWRFQPMPVEIDSPFEGLKRYSRAIYTADFMLKLPKFDGQVYIEVKG